MSKTWKLETVERDRDGTFTLELVSGTDGEGIAFAVVDATFYSDKPFFYTDKVELLSTMGWTTQKPSDMDIQHWLTSHLSEVKDAILKEYERWSTSEQRMCGSWS